MTTYNSIEDFLNDLEEAVASSLKEAGEKVTETMSQTIYRLVYASYSPNMYQRTGRLLNAPKVLNCTKDSITIGLQDANYRDITNDIDSLEEIVDMFSSGQIIAKGSILSANPPLIIYRPAVPLSQELTNNLDDVEKTFIDILSSKGF